MLQWLKNQSVLDWLLLFWMSMLAVCLVCIIIDCSIKGSPCTDFIANLFRCLPSPVH